ncbi:MAG TPA: BolA family protein [Caulobacteraceae bacterium]|nr:BolA family protein [Caulobacteraceae bacterium]
MGAVTDAIRTKLEAKFAPARLDIADDSDRHSGHAGHREGGESHFTITIESAAFAGVGRVARQRMVYAALADELAGPVHALSVKALAPGEH